MTCARDHRQAGRLRLVMIATAVSASVVGRPLHAQTPAPAPPSAGVVRPSPNIDPGIKVAPKRKVQLPMPVIHPPVVKGDTVVVPK